MADVTRPLLEGRGGPIRFPVVEGHTLELKHHIIQLIQNNCQFHGLAKEDANTHLRNFLKLADTFTQRGIPQTTIYLHLFPFSLTYHAQTWFDSLKPQSITSWNDLATKFLQKYFPASKLTQTRNDIINFRQEVGESLYDAWERFKGLLQKCPNHNLDDTHVIQTFYNGLTMVHRPTLDAAAHGNLMDFTASEAWDLIEKLTEQHHDWRSSNSPSPIASPSSGRSEMDL